MAGDRAPAFSPAQAHCFYWLVKLRCTKIITSRKKKIIKNHFAQGFAQDMGFMWVNARSFRHRSGCIRSRFYTKYFWLGQILLMNTISSAVLLFPTGPPGANQTIQAAAAAAVVVAQDAWLNTSLHGFDIRRLQPCMLHDGSSKANFNITGVLESLILWCREGRNCSYYSASRAAGVQADVGRIPHQNTVGLLWKRLIHKRGSHK